MCFFLQKRNGTGQPFAGFTSNRVEWNEIKSPFQRKITDWGEMRRVWVKYLRMEWLKFILGTWYGLGSSWSQYLCNVINKPICALLNPRYCRSGSTKNSTKPNINISAAAIIVLANIAKRTYTGCIEKPFCFSPALDSEHLEVY